MKIGDRAKYIGGSPWQKDRYVGDMCTILEVRESPFNDCRVAFDSFPECNHRDYFNWFYVSQEELEIIN